MKKLIALTIVASIMLVCLLSCARKDALQTPSGRLIGTWKLTQTATDDNNNLVLDNQELRDVDTNDVEYLNFKSDGTGAEQVSRNDSPSTSYLFTYKLIGYDSLIRNYDSGDSIISHLDNLATYSMTIRNYSSPVLSWFFYRKV